MLVLSRKPGEKIILGEGITLAVLAVQGNTIRVGVEAPDHIRILRGELGCLPDLDDHPEVVGTASDVGPEPSCLPLLSPGAA